jgi:hypothetical protein
MPRSYRPPKTDEQREQERRQRKFQEDLELIAQYGDENDFVAALKGYKPDLTKGRTIGVDYAVSRRRPRDARTLLTMRSKFSSAL